MKNFMFLLDQASLNTELAIIIFLVLWVQIPGFFNYEIQGIPFL
jgi:hypothetical protein